MQRQQLHECHGGNGAVSWTDVLNKGDLNGRRVNFIHDDILSSGVSIGLHEHTKEEEYYYIISGKGIMTLDSHDFEVTAGDITVVFPGGRHAIRNIGSDDLRLIVFNVAADV